MGARQLIRHNNRVLNKTASPNWKEALATVIASDYHYARLRDLALDGCVDQSFFVISFSYVVSGETFYGDFEQHGSMDLGEHFSVLYDMRNPSINSFSKVKETFLSRMVFWSLSMAFAALVIYLQRHFNLPNTEFPSN